MSSRDIEGENLLYLSQAKIYTGSCAVGPWIVVGTTEAEARQWSISSRSGAASETVFAGETRAGQIKRRSPSSSSICSAPKPSPTAPILLTGAGIVPPDSFTLEAHDAVRITISGVGTLENVVSIV